MRRLGSLIVARPWWVLGFLVPLLAVAGLVGSSAESHLSTGGFTDPSWESSRAQALLQQSFPGAQPNLVVLVTATRGQVDDPSVVAAATALTRKLTATSGIAGVAGYWTTGLPSLRSQDGSRGLIVAEITGGEAAVRDAVDRIAGDLQGQPGVTGVTLGGPAVAQAEITRQSADDLRRAELITVPITAVLLLLLFGSVAGASLPLVVGGVAAVGTLCLLRLLTGATDVSVFALNVTTGLSLGLGIDYSLLIVTRYREEMRAGRARERALLRTLETAGRTVLFSAVTVAIGLASLAIFPVAFFRSFAYAGVGVVALAAFGAVVVLPAVLHVLGPRVEWGRLPRGADSARADRFWYRQAHAVMRRPVLVTVLVVVVLLVMGSPFARITLGDDDERILPSAASARVVGDALRSDFAVNPGWTAAIVVPGGATPAQLTTYATAVS